MSKIALFLIKAYKYFPPLGPSRCIYTPTCSEYAKEAFLKYPFLKALSLVTLRILRCNPLSRGGFDPVNPVRDGLSKVTAASNNGVISNGVK